MRRAAVAALALAACSGVTGERPPDAAPDVAIDAAADAPPPQIFAELHAAWGVTDLAGDAEPCIASAPNAVLIAFPTAGNRAPIYDLFDCAAGAGTGTYEVGTYAFELDLADNLDVDVYVASQRITVDLSADTPLTFPLLTDGGYFHVTWTLVGATSGNALTCADAGATTIAVTATAQGAPIVSTFDCAAGSGVSPGLPAGTYAATVQAEGAGATVLGAAPALAGEMIAAQNHVTEWGSVQIAIDGQ